MNNIEIILLAINIIIILALLLSIIYTLGVVWRVEKKLDTSYKYFLAAIIFLFFAETIDLFPNPDYTIEISIAVKIFRMLFVLCFLIGIIIMRNIIRRLDGELKNND